MKRTGLLRLMAGAFGLALLLYAAAFWWIEHTRHRKGAWDVRFTSTNGTPALVIHQPRVGVTNVTLLFPGKTMTHAAATVRFDAARPVPFDLPFGQCIFLDTTFLPGTVTMRLFAHEVELLPRTLILDHRERAWRAGEVISVGRARGE